MMVDRHQFAVNSFWKILEQFSAKGISMLVSIVLARILLPSDYGLIALTTVFTNLSDILIDAGFSTALIRKEKVDDYDYSAVFSVSLLMAVVLYTILFFIAPYVADYYTTSDLTLVLRVVGLTFFLQSVTAVRTGIVNRNMQFRLLFVCHTTASIVSGVVGIAAAYSGFGVWALVLQRLMQQMVLATMLFIKVKWKISWKFDRLRIKQMLPFSMGIVGSSLLNYFGGTIYGVAIGKKYSVTDLGYYDKGNQLPMQFALYTFGAMSNVLLPTISSLQSDLERVTHIVRKVVRMTSLLIMPLMIGMVLVSKEMIVLLFTDKWLLSVPIMQCGCLYYLATPYMLINVQIFFALGKSNLRVKTEIIRLTMLATGLALFGFVLNYSMNILALVGALIAVVMALVTYYEVRKLIDYKLHEVLLDLWKPVTASIIMGCVIFAIEMVHPIASNIISILVKVSIGIVVYGAFAFVLKIPELKDLTDLIHRRKQ